MSDHRKLLERADQVRQLAAGGAPQPMTVQLPSFGNAPTTSASPVDQMLGRTPQQPDPGTVRPRVGLPPVGQSGRANFYGLPQPDETNAQLIGAQGLRNFDLMYRTDPDVRRLILMAWSPIVAATWSLEPYGGDEATDQDRTIADTVWWALTKFMSPNLFEHLNTVGPLLLRSGFTPFEQIWDTTTYKGKTLTVPRKLDVRLPRSIWRWWQDEWGELTHVGQILPNKPDVVIDANDLVYYRLAGEGDNWVGTSLLRHAYKPWVMKDRLERIDAIGQERKAVGVPIVYPPESADDSQRDAVETVLASLHTNEVGYLVMPGPHAQDVKDTAGVQGWRVDVITFDSSAGTSIQDSLKYHRDGIASAFLGDFMQLGHHQVGARATADVQEDPFLTAVEALALYVLPPLNRLVARIVELNWPGAQGAPELNISLQDNASLSEIAAYVQQLVAAGAMVADADLEDWLRERADLPPANQEMRDKKQALQDQQMAAQIAGAQFQEQNPGPPAPPPGAPPAGPGKPGAPTPAGKAPAKPPADSQKPGGKRKLDASVPLTVTDRVQRVTPDGGLLAGEGSIIAASADADGAIVYGVRWDDGGHSIGRDYELRRLDDAPEPTPKWWERLLSQDRLREALDGARQHIEASSRAEAMCVAQVAALHASNGSSSEPDTTALADSLTAHFESMYRLGGTTVRDELGRQRRVLQLDGPPSDLIDTVIAGTRYARQRQRGEHAARTITQRVVEKVRQQTINGRTDGPRLQLIAEAAAKGALHEVALQNTSASINDGRADAAAADAQVVGGYYTAVLDQNSCDSCIALDDGQLLPVDQALTIGPPNASCDGGDRCRCTIVWVLSNDPAAAQLG